MSKELGVLQAWVPAFVEDERPAKLPPCPLWPSGEAHGPWGRAQRLQVTCCVGTQEDRTLPILPGESCIPVPGLPWQITT